MNHAKYFLISTLIFVSEFVMAEPDQSWHLEPFELRPMHCQSWHFTGALHDSAMGGPLAYVQNGDRIRLSVANREIALLVSDDELARRATANPVIVPTAKRGYRKLFLQTVTQADQGVDFDFLRGTETRGAIPKL